MSHHVKPIPAGHNSVSPYLIIKNATAAIEFYKKAFGATVVLCMPREDNKIAHAELKIGDSIIMLADECPEMKALSAQTIGGSPVMMHLYIAAVDDVVAQAVATGAQVVRPVQDQCFGDRSGMIADPFGYTWNIATHIEDLTLEEIQQRMAAARK